MGRGKKKEGQNLVRILNCEGWEKTKELQKSKRNTKRKVVTAKNPVSEPKKKEAAV